MLSHKENSALKVLDKGRGFVKKTVKECLIDGGEQKNIGLVLREVQVLVYRLLNRLPVLTLVMLELMMGLMGKVLLLFCLCLY
jgi:hypothetical protein